MADPIPGDTLATTGAFPHPDQATSTDSSATDSAGTWPSIAGYAIEGILGRGGMGVVYKARQTALNRIVALKMLRTGDSADADEIDRFRAEAEAVARLQHPNIVQIFDVGQQEGRAYFSLEYVTGGTLANKLRGTPLLPRAAAQLVEQLANTIQYAHERNILHRDLKPSNILLTPEGQPKIADFGLAKKLDTDDGRTRTGAVVGTPSYMAPEQAWGQSKHVGPRVDVYALGAILYECLTGRPPFQGATVMETLDQVRKREPVPLRALNPSVPRDLETICLKCLQKEPARRYLTARDLALDLRRFLDGEPVVARPLGAVGRLWRTARRHPTAALATVLTVLTLLFGVGGGLAWYLYQATETARQNEVALRAKAEQAEKDATDAQHRAEVLATRLERVLTLQRVQASVREWQRNDIGRARGLLEDCPVEQRGWEWHYARRLLTPWREMSGILGSIESVAFLPDGKRILSGGSLDGLRVWDVETGKELFYLEGSERRSSPGGGFGQAGYRPVTFGLLPERGEIVGNPRGAQSVDFWSIPTGKRLRSLEVGKGMPRNRIALAPDGRWLAFSAYGSNVAFTKPPIFLIDLPAGKDLPKMEGHTSMPPVLAASPDGTLLASFGADGDGRLWDMKEFKQLREIQGGAFGMTGLVFASDGSMLYGCGQDGIVRSWSMPGAAPERSFSLAPLKLTCLAVRPDGKMLACGTASGEVVLVSPFNEKEQAIYRGHLQPYPGILCLAFSPDGTRVVSAGTDGALRVWDTTQRQEVERRQVPLATGATVVLDARGRFLFTGGQNGAVRHWTLPEGSPGKQTATGNAIRHLAPASAERRVAISSSGPAGCSVRVWDWDADRIVLELPNLADFVEYLALSADGRQLFVAGTAGPGLFLRSWDVESGRETPAPPRPASQLVGMALSPDGKLLATQTWATQTNEGVLSVLSLPGGQEQFHYRAARHSDSPRFSLDGKMLACSTFGGVRVWDTSNWQEILRGTMRGTSAQLTFSPDGSRLAAASTPVTVWDLRSGQEALTLPESGPVLTLAFSADSQTLMGAGADGSVDFWHGEPLR
jgi:WD40 repeat protein